MEENWMWGYEPIIPAMPESLEQEDHNLGKLGEKMRSYLQNNQSKKGWQHGSSSRVLA
jgi:hypothetical protein